MMIHRAKCSLFAVLVITLLFAGATPLRGQNFKVSAVNIEGNAEYKDAQLFRLMITRPPGLFSKTRFHNDIFQDDLEKLRLYYRQNGFLKADIEQFRVDVDSASEEVKITIRLYEGERTFITSLEFSGNSLFPHDSLLAVIPLRAGDPLNRRKIEQASLSLVSRYGEQGFLDVEVESDIVLSDDSLGASVNYIITERTRYTVGEVNLRGLEKTKPAIVRRHLQLRHGEPVNHVRLLALQRKIYLTGLFQSVFIRPAPAASGDSTEKDIIVDLKEHMSGEFNTAAGYGSIEKLIGRVELLNNNIRGTARKFGLSGEWSFINRLAALSFSEPSTFGTPWSSDLNLSAEYRDEPGYDLNRAGGQFTVGRLFGERLKSTFSYRNENATLKNIDLEKGKLPRDLTTTTRSFKNTISYDSRDELINTNRGIYLELANEIGVFFANGRNTFFQSSIKARYFTPVTRKSIVGSGLELSWITSQGGISAIPLHERFYAGGPNSVRGFNYRKLGPLDSERVPLGGRFKFVWNLFELRRTLYKMIGGAVFLDMGNVWLAPKDFSPSDIRFSSGVGLRINTPIGLGRADYSFNLDPRDGEPSSKIYVGVGQAF